MAFEYRWWDLEDSKFKGVLQNTIGCFWLYDHPYQTWEEFEQDLPHMAFTQLVYTRFETLERLFVDIRVVTQMLGAVDVPVKSVEMNINRYDWLKSALDLKLLRFSSIRDVSFHFVNEVLGLNIEEMKLTQKTLKKALGSRAELIAVLDEICAAGMELRAERNLRAHVGVADLRTEDDQMFRNMAWAEANGNVLVDYDIKAIYMEVSERMYTRLVDETDRLLAAVIRMVDELIPDFEVMYQKRRSWINHE